MPNRLPPILLAMVLAALATGLLGCGGDNAPAPSIPPESARTLLSKLAEIKANVDVGSCLVAADKTDDLLADVDALPSSTNQQVQNALVRGANNLKGLLTDPTKCQSRSATTTTTAPPTAPATTQQTTTTQRTQPTTTTRTQPTTTTPTQTQTPTTTPGGTSGGIGPGGP